MQFINALFEENRKKLEEVQAANQLLVEENRVLKYRVSDLECNHNELDQYIRRENLVISGVPQTESENTDAIALKIAQIADKNITMSDIDVSHRIGKRKPSVGQRYNPPSQIIVRFTSRRARDAVYKARKNLSTVKTSSLGYEVTNDIYINENLTPIGKALFTKVNIKRKQCGWKFLWTHYGKILTKKDENSPVVYIPNEDSLCKIC
uniref:Uncharacterized protein LOC102803782 n=1 Tax=Saccoglossus kowalevskii TaxID=10224 RepID=A0ABM0MT26_SACKO|nr:PREDICTED: uncharacterized protein LOC102803782 [Saccoglossus kowalevskii]